METTLEQLVNNQDKMIAKYEEIIEVKDRIISNLEDQLDLYKKLVDALKRSEVNNDNNQEVKVGL